MIKDEDLKTNEMENNRRIKVMLEAMLRAARNSNVEIPLNSSKYSYYNKTKLKPVNKIDNVLITLNEFKIHKAENEIFLSIKIDNKFNELDEKGFKKEVKKYTDDVKNLFGITCRPKIKKFHILYNLWIIHAIYKLPKNQLDALLDSADMLIAIKKSSI